MDKQFKPRLKTESTVIVAANWFQFTPGQRIVYPQVGSRMLLWSYAGRGRVRVNGTWHSLETDQFLFLPWHHAIQYAADAERPFWVGGIHLIPDHARTRKVELTVSHHPKDVEASWRWRRDVAWPGLEEVRQGVAQASEPLRLLATYIVERFGMISRSEVSLRLLARWLIEEVVEALSGKAAGTGNEVVRRAQEFVAAHMGESITLTDLARWSDCSISTMRRQFQQALGVPPYEWILDTRMRRAQQLLATTTMRIKEVAGRVGFEDAFQFSRIFKQRIGRSPRAFREGQAFHPQRLAR
jgi:AraC-like DNA-binding protein